MSRICKTSIELLEENIKKCLDYNLEGMKILSSIVQNILYFPNEKKYRKLSKTSPKLSKLLSHELQHILVFLDFSELDDMLQFDASDLGKLSKSFQLIKLFMKIHSTTSKQEIAHEVISILETCHDLEPRETIKELQQLLSICKRYFWMTLVISTIYVDLGAAYMSLNDERSQYDAFKEAVAVFPKTEVSEAIETDDKIALLTLARAYERVLTSGITRMDDRKDHVFVYECLTIFYEISVCPSVLETDSEYLKEAIKIGITFGIAIKNKDIEQLWRAKQKEHSLPPDQSDLQNRFLAEESGICDENAKESIDEILSIIAEALKRKDECDDRYAACLYGQIIYHHRRFSTLNPLDGIAYGQKGLDILLPITGLNDPVVRNIYLSMTDIYFRSGQIDLAKKCKEKMDQCNRLLESRIDHE
jgi:tetratricopeptide (TPR) repeat protein